MRTMRPPGWKIAAVLLVGILAISFGSILVRLALRASGDQSLAFSLVMSAGRLALAALLLAPGWTRPLEGRAGLPFALAAGGFLALHFAFWITSLSYTSVAASTALVTTNPVWVTLLGWWLFGERPSFLTLLGVGVALLGGVLIGLGDSEGGGGANPLLGDFLALLGAVDDLAGSRLRPLRAREKLLAQGVLGLVFALWASRLVNYTPWPWLDVLLILLAVVGAANAFNFTDGLDGLLASVTAVILLPFYPYPLAQALLGGVLGFLWHNAPRAKVFMGDTGSQALGAMVAGLFVLTGKLWLLPLAAIVPVVEVLSVVAQVAYFRRTGRRLLRMSPLHHHFELLGWDEAKIVFRFAVVTALAVALAFGGGG